MLSRVLLFPVSDILSVQLRGQTVEAREVARAAETAFLGSQDTLGNTGAAPHLSKVTYNTPTDSLIQFRKREK